MSRKKHFATKLAPPKVRKYLTEIPEGQRSWIKKAAKDLDIREPELIQMAVGRLISNDWAKIKADWEKNKAKARLEELEREKERLEMEQNTLKALVFPRSVEVNSVKP